ncbi:MAG: phospholipase D-like domain-containing protein, partial [Stellaceae bacterium]
RARLLSNSHYFRSLARSLERARRSVLILGWDLDPRLLLDNAGDRRAHVPLSEFLHSLLAREPALHIRVLLWDRTIFYGGNRKSAVALQRLAETENRFEHCYHPAKFATSHHAKLVSIDDDIAFVGGIDLTGNRWDLEDHPPRHPQRVTPAGEIYGPIHDLQMLVEGPAARALSEFAHGRWRSATGKTVPTQATARTSAWPPELAPDFRNVPAGIARTLPAETGNAVREIAALNRSALAGARSAIYIETQYLTSEAVGDMLARRLEEPGGPEVVIVVTRKSRGHLEQLVMGGNRDRLLRRLAAADRWGRLRVFYPSVRGVGIHVDIKIHAKLIIVDDRFLRVGSSNLNNRSISVDTECDIAIEPRDAAGRGKVAELRHRLIAELLRCSTAEIAAAVEANQSLIKGIEALNRQGCLRSMLDTDEPSPREPLPGTAILDPKDPIAPADLWSRIAASLGRLRRSARRAASGERADEPAASAGRRDEPRPEDPRNACQSRH